MGEPKPLRSEVRRAGALRDEVQRVNGILPRYCTAELSRHGRLCVYFRKIGETGRVRMRDDVGSPAFYASYASLLAGNMPAAPQRRRTATKIGTWRWLCEQYFQSIPYRQLAVRGQCIRRRELEATYVEPTAPGSQHLMGDCPLDRFNASAVRLLRDRKIKLSANSPIEAGPTNLEAANCRLKYIRAVLKWGKENCPELITRNWAQDVDYYHSQTEGHHTWTLEEIERFEARHPVGTKARLALALALYTGQRRGDIARLGRNLERNGMLQFVQEKNNSRRPITAFVPIVPALHAIIGASPTGDPFYIVQRNGRPYSKESLGNLFRAWCNEAGLPHCSLHGLRKACVVRLIMEDCTPHQIMAVTGHQTLKEIDRYARRYIREKAAERILTAWLGRHANE